MTWRRFPATVLIAAGAMLVGGCASGGGGGTEGEGATPGVEGQDTTAIDTMETMGADTMMEDTTGM